MHRIVWQAVGFESGIFSMQTWKPGKKVSICWDDAWQQWDSNPGPLYHGLAQLISHWHCYYINQNMNSGSLCGRMEKAMVSWSEDHKFESRRNRYTCTVHFWTQMLASVTGLGCFTQPWLPGLVCSPGPLEKVCLSQQRSARSAIILDHFISKCGKVHLNRMSVSVPLGRFP